MSFPLRAYDVVPGTRLLCVVLADLGGVSIERKQTDPLPFTIIQRYDGHTDASTDHGFYQLDHLSSAADGMTAFTACEEYERRCFRRLMWFHDHPWAEVTVPGWGVATVDRIRCLERAVQVPYPVTGVERLVSRWTIHLRLERVTT